MSGRSRQLQPKPVKITAFQVLTDQSGPLLFPRHIVSGQAAVDIVGEVEAVGEVAVLGQVSQEVHAVAATAIHVRVVLRVTGKTWKEKLKKKNTRSMMGRVPPRSSILRLIQTNCHKRQ